MLLNLNISNKSVRDNNARNYNNEIKSYQTTLKNTDKVHFTSNIVKKTSPINKVILPMALSIPVIIMNQKTGKKESFFTKILNFFGIKTKKQKEQEKKELQIKNKLLEELTEGNIDLDTVKNAKETIKRTDVSKKEKRETAQKLLKKCGLEAIGDDEDDELEIVTKSIEKTEKDIEKDSKLQQTIKLQQELKQERNRTSNLQSRVRAQIARANAKEAAISKYKPIIEKMATKGITPEEVTKILDEEDLPAKIKEEDEFYDIEEEDLSAECSPKSEKRSMLPEIPEKSSKSKAAKTGSTGLWSTIGRLGLKTVELILGLGAIGAALEGRTPTLPTSTGIVPYTGSYDFSNNNMYCNPKDLNVPSPWNNRDSSFIAYPTFSYNLSDVPASEGYQQYLLFSQSTPSSLALVPFSSRPPVIKPPVCPVQEFSRSRELVVKTDTSLPVSNPVAQEENNALQNIVEQNGEDYDLTGTIFAQEAEEQPENISQPDMFEEPEEAVINTDQDLTLSSPAKDCKALVLVDPTDISKRLAYNESLQSPQTPEELAEKADNMLQTTLLGMCTPDNSLLHFDASDINGHSESLGACAAYLDDAFGSQRLTGKSTKENLITIGAQAKTDAENAQGHLYTDYQKQAQCYYVAQHAYTLAGKKEDARKCAHECQKASAPGVLLAGNPELNALSKKNETLFLKENQSL